MSLALFCLTPDPLPDDPPPLVRQAVREKWMFYTLKQGLQGLPETMRRVVEEMGVKILSRQPCIALKFTTNGVQVQLLLNFNRQEYDSGFISLEKKTVLCYEKSPTVQDAFWPIPALMTRDLLSIY